MRRFYNEIEQIPQNVDWAPAPIYILGFGEEHQESQFRAAVKHQLVPAQDCGFCCGAVDLSALSSRICQEWVLLMDAAVSLVPHGILALKDVIQEEKFDAMIAGEAWLDDQIPAGCCAGSLTLLAEGQGSGRANLLIRRSLLAELLQALSPENDRLSGPQWMGQLAQLLLERQIPVRELPRLLFTRKDAAANPPSFCRKPGRKRILAVSHELSLTGAPIVFHQAVEVLRRNGYAVQLLSPSDGPMYDLFHRDGVPVSYDRFLSRREEPYWAQIAKDYDAVMVNTIVGHWVVDRLQSYGIPIFWWLHESEMLFPAMAPAMPDQISSHVHVYCVSDYALQVCNRLKPNYHPQRLIYGLQDLLDTPCQESPIEKGTRMLFTQIGTLDSLKGQDVLLHAIEKLPRSIADQCVFLFIGKRGQEPICQLLDAACQRDPIGIQYIPQVPREAMSSIFRQSDCIICASRDDSMPTVLAEGWMFSTPCICSEHTGTASLIHNGENGLVYQKDDPRELAAKIQQFFTMSEDQRTNMGRQGRKTFEFVFTLQQFEKNILNIFSSMLSADIS